MLVVGNEYGSNLGLMHQTTYLRMSIWITLVNLLMRLVSTFTRCLVMDGNIESAAEVDIWKKKFVLGQSLYNPQALSDLGDTNVPAKQVVHAGVYRWRLLRWCQN